MLAVKSFFQLETTNWILGSVNNQVFREQSFFGEMIVKELL